jgi:hypothetical protein
LEIPGVASPSKGEKLPDLLKNKDYDQITGCKSLKTNWIDLLPDSSKTFTDARLYRHGHPDDGNMPVQ